MPYRIENVDGRYLIFDSENHKLGDFGIRRVAAERVAHYEEMDRIQEKANLENTKA